MIAPYQNIPSLAQWKKDSFIDNNRVTRAQDKALLGIDNIVESLAHTTLGSDRAYLLGELYFSTNFWLRNLKQNPTVMQAGREDAVRQLLRVAVISLSAVFKCTVNVLPTKLEQYYGKAMCSHGVQQDTIGALGSSHYMERAKAERFKLRFSGGKASWINWWNNQSTYPIVELADTERPYLMTQDKGTAPGTLQDGWAFFAMSMSRDIYVGPHFPKNTHGEGAYVHSSWLGGQAVQCAGSICVRQGVVVGLQNNSGHYKPSDEHMVNVLAHLKMLGVDISKVMVFDYATQPKGGVKGDVFLAAKGDWEKILGRGDMTTPQFMEGNHALRIRRDEETIIRNNLREVQAHRLDLHGLVERKFLVLKRNEKSGKDDRTLWSEAYGVVCLEFAEIDPSWNLRAKQPAIPRRVVPGRPNG